MSPFGKGAQGRQKPEPEATPRSQASWAKAGQVLTSLAFMVIRFIIFMLIRFPIFATVAILRIMIAICSAVANELERLDGYIKQYPSNRQARLALKAKMAAERRRIKDITDEEEQRRELTSQRDSLQEVVDDRTQTAAVAMLANKDAINVKAWLAVFMTAFCIYELIATTSQPFPGWHLVEALPGGGLLWIGVSYGWLLLIASQLIVAAVNPDAVTKQQRHMLEQETAGNRRLYWRRWTWEIGLGSISWLAIAATAVDLGLSYDVGVGIAHLLYQHPDVNNNTFTALISLTQMILGGGIWLVRMLAIFGIKAADEKTLDWTKAMLAAHTESEEQRHPQRYWLLWSIHKGVIFGGEAVWAGLTILLYSGYMDQPHLQGAQAQIVQVLLLVGQASSGAFFVGLSSWLTRGVAVSRWQKLEGMARDLKNIVLTIPGFFGATVGNVAVQIFGHGYTHQMATEVSAVFQQGFNIPAGAVQPYYQARENSKQEVRRHESQSATAAGANPDARTGESTDPGAAS